MTPDIQVDEEGERKTSIGTGGDKRAALGCVGKGLSFTKFLVLFFLKAAGHNYTITTLFFHVTLPQKLTKYLHSHMFPVQISKNRYVKYQPIGSVGVSARGLHTCT